MPDRSRFSPDFLRDPTRSDHLIRRYEDRLVPLFRRYGERIVEELRNPHYQEVTFRIDPGRFFLIMDTLLKGEVLDPGWQIIQDEIPRGYAHGYSFGAIAIGLGAPPDIRRLEAEKIAILLEANRAALKGIGDETTKQIRKVISDGLLREQTQGEIIQGIMDRSSAIGETRARAMARTEVMAAVNRGVLDQYARQGIDVSQAPPCPAHVNCRCTYIPARNGGVEWLAALDERTCTDTFTANGYTYEGGCEGMDGRIFGGSGTTQKAQQEIPALPRDEISSALEGPFLLLDLTGAPASGRASVAEVA
jgi:hypothetical protein